jgi:hypothetical protein
VKLIRINSEYGIAFVNPELLPGIAVDVNSRRVRFTFPNGQYDQYTLRTEEEAARLVRELDMYTVDAAYNTEV